MSQRACKTWRGCDECGEVFPSVIFTLYEETGEVGCPACNPLEVPQGHWGREMDVPAESGRESA